MHRKSIVLVAIFGAILLMFGFSERGQAASFFRVLKIGDNGDDVLVLQRILNQDARTAVALSGPGSVGLETRQFGGLTKAAVIKFQELYGAEVLAPIGLVRGTGFVGTATLKKLESLAIGPTATLVMSSVSPSRALPGSMITVYGLGFTGKSTVLFSGAPVPTTYVRQDTLRFNVPMYVSGARHDVSVRGEDGTVSAVMTMLIDGQGSALPGAPFISRISPERGGLGTTIVITGSGFATSSTNTINTGYAKLSGLVSMDGTTLSFTIPSYLSQFDFSQADFTGLPEATLPFGISVENTNGVSDAKLFTFIIH